MRRFHSHENGGCPAPHLKQVIKGMWKLDWALRCVPELPTAPSKGGPFQHAGWLLFCEAASLPFPTGECYVLSEVQSKTVLEGMQLSIPQAAFPSLIHLPGIIPTWHGGAVQRHQRSSPSSKGEGGIIHLQGRLRGSSQNPSQNPGEMAQALRVV